MQQAQQAQQQAQQLMQQQAQQQMQQQMRQQMQQAPEKMQQPPIRIMVPSNFVQGQSLKISTTSGLMTIPVPSGTVLTPGLSLNVQLPPGVHFLPPAPP